MALWISTILVAASTMLAPLFPRLIKFLINRLGEREKPMPETVWAILYLLCLFIALTLDFIVLWGQTSQSGYQSQSSQLITALTIIVAATQVSGLRVRVALQDLRKVLREHKEEWLDAGAKMLEPIHLRLRSIELGVDKLNQKPAASQRALDEPLETTEDPDSQLVAFDELPSQNKALVPFPITIPKITIIDLFAGILAMALKLHEENGALRRFTHVKAEKIAHMIEAQVGINLGREPIKGAAGPSDFHQLRTVEDRARAAKYFDFKQEAGGTYRAHKLSRFDDLIKLTRDALGPHCAEVDHLLRWMLRMNVKQAEIVATVFAAWNNLLLIGKQPTDEEIVFEARENWHENKRRIERQRFFSAVDWLRKQQKAPQGKGRLVRDKEEPREELGRWLDCDL